MITPQSRPDAPTLRDARALDALDELAPLRKRFALPDGIVYFDGNSLGALVDTVPATMNEVITGEWGTNLIRSWFDDGWWDAPLRVGDLIAPILGCAEGQVVVGDSVSVQLFNLLTAGVRLNPGRARILVDADVFPSDHYIASSVARLLNVELTPVPMADLPQELAARDGDTAVVLASAVDFRSGERWDIGEITRRCHDAGALVLWDLCHAVGAIPVGLDEHRVDLAVGCSYKYLSGGPGAPAFCYIAARHHDAIDLPLTGWHGHQRPFGFAGDYVPAQGISRARVATPHILSMRALEESLAVFRDAPIGLIRAKNLALARFFFACLDALAPERGVGCITPREDRRRGSQVTVTHARSDDIMRGLLERGVICDQRPPDLLRFGFNALYVSFEDVFTGVRALAETVADLT
ncbi:MAG: kynureninase [Actinomycetota bacterium]|nr:kynureninase [Actinomycetota bacterium]